MREIAPELPATGRRRGELLQQPRGDGGAARPFESDSIGGALDSGDAFERGCGGRCGGRRAGDPGVFFTHPSGGRRRRYGSAILHWDGGKRGNATARPLCELDTSRQATHDARAAAGGASRLHVSCG